MSTVVVTDSQQRRNPGCLVQILWFLLVGWWAGQLWILAAWLLMLTIVGIPFGIMMLNSLPKVIALRDASSAGVTVIQRGRTTVIVTGGQAAQHNILLRAVYFLLIGWWLSAIWMEVAYVVTATIIGMPVGFWMFDKVPALVSLRR